MRSLPLNRKSLFLVVLVALLSGCCNETLNISGQVKDSDSGLPLDSVQVSLFQKDKTQAELSDFVDTDSLGQFSFLEMDLCRKDQFFLLLSRPGYLSQSVGLDVDAEELEISLVRE